MDRVVYVGEAELGRVEADGVVEGREALVAVFYELDVGALVAPVSIYFLFSQGHSVSGEGGKVKRKIMVKLTYSKQRRPVRRQLHNLDRRLVPRLDPQVRRHLDFGEAHRPREGRVRRPQELPRGSESGVPVQGPAVGPVGVEPDVDVQEGRGVAREPARLEGESAACRGPVGSIIAEGEAAAYRSAVNISFPSL